MANKPAGEAAPASGGQAAKTAAADNEIGLDVMRDVAAKFGGKIAEPAATAAAEDEDGATETTDNPTEGETEGDSAAAGEESAAAGEGATDENATAEEDAGGEESTEDKAAAEEKARTAETAQLIAAKLKDLPDALRSRVQSVIDARVGKVVATERKAREAAEAAKADAEARATELETELTEAKAAKGAPQAVPADVHPLMLATSEAELDQRLAQIDQAEEFFIRYGDDGYPGKEDDPNDPPIPAPELRLKWRALQRERDRIIPAARQQIKERAVHEAELRKSAPTFFDRKSEDFRAVQAKLKLMPELRRHANATTLAVQLVLGERAMAQKKTAGAVDKNKAATPKAAPRVPGGGGTAKGSPGAQTSARPAASEAVKNVMQRPGDKAAFNNAVASLIDL